MCPANELVIHQKPVTMTKQKACMTNVVSYYPIHDLGNWSKFVFGHIAKIRKEVSSVLHGV